MPDYSSFRRFLDEHPNPWRQGSTTVLVKTAEIKTVDTPDGPMMEIHIKDSDLVSIKLTTQAETE